MKVEVGGALFTPETFPRGGAHIATNRAIGPVWNSGDPQYSRGVPSPVELLDPRPHIDFFYDGTDDPADPGSWYELPDLTSWAACNPDAPDESVLVVPEQVWGGVAPGEGSDFTDADVALKITLRSPRYRWIYSPTHAAAPLHRGRDDGLAAVGAGSAAAVPPASSAATASVAAPTSRARAPAPG
jgi:hypothetical protein